MEDVIGTMVIFAAWWAWSWLRAYEEREGIR
jgi:hypothetical protein